MLKEPLGCPNAEKLPAQTSAIRENDLRGLIAEFRSGPKTPAGLVVSAAAATRTTGAATAAAIITAL